MAREVQHTYIYRYKVSMLFISIGSLICIRDGGSLQAEAMFEQPLPNERERTDQHSAVHHSAKPGRIFLSMIKLTRYRVHLHYLAHWRFVKLPSVGLML